MQLGISQSQHSLVALLHQNYQSNGPIAPKMAKQMFTNFYKLYFFKYILRILTNSKTESHEFSNYGLRDKT